VIRTKLHKSPCHPILTVIEQALSQALTGFRR
jgi:hypothetical protein